VRQDIQRPLYLFCFTYRSTLWPSTSVHRSY
jgi:hypothetical protein